MTSSVARAAAAWNGQPPTWVEQLARACDRASQNLVAAQLEVNAGYISYVLRNQKPQYHIRVEDAVRSRLMGETILCPVLGEIALDRCRSIRTDRRRAIGPVEKKLRNACPKCRFNVTADKEDS